MFFVPYYILILLVTIVVDYFAGVVIERSSGDLKKYWLWGSIVMTCLVLFVFKYFNFFVGNVNELAHFLGWNYSLHALSLILPIGLSFHTFQSLSYVIEVYRGNQQAERHFGIYCLYVMYYPQLVAGPIERPQNLLHQFRRINDFRYANFYRGIRYIIFGLFMKLVVADRLSIYVDAVYNNAFHHSGPTLALATIFFSFQIYCDFAGYSAIAIGASRVMGIKLMTNFRRPYLSRSISEFWRRWHISLSTWFKDYLYISLGGSRRGKFRTNVNLMITFIVSGLWHGANWTYVIWGMLNGLYLVFENTFWNRRQNTGRKRSGLRFIGTLYVFVLISLAWIFFRSDNIATAWKIVESIARFSGRLFVPDNAEVLIYCLIATGLLIAYEIGFEHVYLRRRIRISPVGVSNFAMLAMIVLILLIGVFDGSQFIYFQF